MPYGKCDQCYKQPLCDNCTWPWVGRQDSTRCCDCSGETHHAPTQPNLTELFGEDHPTTAHVGGSAYQQTSGSESTGASIADSSQIASSTAHGDAKANSVVTKVDTLGRHQDSFCSADSTPSPGGQGQYVGKSSQGDHPQKRDFVAAQCDFAPVTPSRTPSALSPEGEQFYDQCDSFPVTPTRGNPASPVTHWLDSNPPTPSGSGSEPLPLDPVLQEDPPDIYGNFSGDCTWKEHITPGWVRVKTIVDSGAAMSIAPPSMATRVRVGES